MSIFTPLPNDFYSLPRVQVLFRAQGASKWINLGDAEAFTLSYDLTEIERYGKDDSVKVFRRTDVIQRAANLSMTLMQMSDALRGMMFLTDTGSYLEQEAVAAGNASFSGIAAGDIYSLGAADVSITSITDGTVEPVNYEAGVHYKIDRRTGFIEIIAVPDGADDELKVAFSAPAIEGTAKRFNGGLLSNNGVRGSLFLRGQGDVGPNDEITLWDVQLRPDGDLNLQGEDDYSQIQIAGRLYADGTQAPGFEYGRIRSIPKSALV